MTERRSRRLAEIVAAAWDVAHEVGLGAVSLHEVARRVGMRQPSLYGYVSSKLDLYDVMYAEAYEQLLERLDSLAVTGTARQQLLDVSRAVVDFAVEDPARQQLVFQRTLPGFEPSEASYALAVRAVDRPARLLAALGKGSRDHVDVYTALVGGLAAQQTANEPGGDRWTRHLEHVLEVFLDHFDPTRAQERP